MLRIILLIIYLSKTLSQPILSFYPKSVYGSIKHYVILQYSYCVLFGIKNQKTFILEIWINLRILIIVKCSSTLDFTKVHINAMIAIQNNALHVYNRINSIRNAERTVFDCDDFKT